MPIYEFVSGCYSDTISTILQHEKNFTKQEFTDICNSVAKEVNASAEVKHYNANCPYTHYNKEYIQVLKDSYDFRDCPHYCWHVYNYNREDNDGTNAEVTLLETENI